MSTGLTYRLLRRLQTRENVSYDAMELIHSTSLNKSLFYKDAIYLRAPPQPYSIGNDVFRIT